jgi:3-oxoacyl-[acyl-carrier-protein] synthase II
MTLAASGACLEQAGLFADGALTIDGDEMATVIGTSRPEYGGFQRFSPPVLNGQPGKLNPALFPFLARSVACGQTCITFGLRGYSSNLAAGPLSGLHAIGRGYDLVRHGQTRFALVGGAECLSKTSLVQSRKMYDGYLDLDRPDFFGADPGLIVPGEGVTILLLEDQESAQRRGATPLATISGYRMGRLGEGEPTARCRHLLGETLDECGLDWSRIGVISTSASGGNMPHDRVEHAVLGRLTEETGHRPRVCACRSFAGEAEAASSAMQVAVTVEALSSGVIPPTLNTAVAEPPNGTGKPDAALVTALDSSGFYAFMTLTRA